MIRSPICYNIKQLVLFLNKLFSALIVTGGSAFCFGEQYRDLLLYLHQKLDENNSNQQVHTAYIQNTMVCSHVASNSVLFAKSGDTTSGVRQQGEELFGETYGRRNRRRKVYTSIEV